MLVGVSIAVHFSVYFIYYYRFSVNYCDKNRTPESSWPTNTTIIDAYDVVESKSGEKKSRFVIAAERACRTPHGAK